MAEQDTTKSEQTSVGSVLPHGAAAERNGQGQAIPEGLDKLPTLTYPYIVEKETGVAKGEVDVPYGGQSGDLPAAAFGRFGEFQLSAADSVKSYASGERLQTERERIESLFRDYLSDVQALGIASAVLVGSKAGERLGYIWNVFSEDFAPEHGLDPRLEDLNSRSYQLQRALSGIMPLRIAHANPSQLGKLRHRCKQRDIDTELVAF